MSLYIEIRCIHCEHMSVYANDIRDTVVCDYCVRDINKMDGMIAHQKPPYHKLRNELRKRRT